MMVPTLSPQYELLPKAPFAWASWFTFCRFLAGNPDHRKQEGFYQRCIYAPAKHEYCLQVVLYYRRQIFPYHINDYHPFYAYFNESHQLVRLLYDASHHQARCAPLAQHYTLTIRFPWHGYHLGGSHLSIPFRASHFDLTDDVLRGWWLQSDMPQFKIRTKCFDPWNPGLMSHDQTPGNFRDEAICPYCGAVELLDAMSLKDGIWRIQLQCRNGHRFAAVNDSSVMRLECVKI